MEFLLALLLAAGGTLIPTTLYVTIAWWLDRYEKEPLWLMGLAFIWGAIPAIIMALIAEIGLVIPLALLSPETDLTVVSTVLIAPPVEELIKAFPLLLMFVFFRREFDGLMDGLLYGALVGFGFAMTENFLYFLSAYQSGGFGSLFVTIFLRTIVFGMMHALWTSMLGLGLGIARYATNTAWLVLPPVLGLATGIALHMVHNYGATHGGWFVVLMAFSYFSGCTFWLGLVFYAGFREAEWIREELRDEVASGLLTEAQALASFRYRARVANRWAGMMEHGMGHTLQLGKLYSLSAKLAMKKRQLTIHPQVAMYAQEVDRLRDEITQIQHRLRQATPGLTSASGAIIEARVVKDRRSD